MEKLLFEKIDCNSDNLWVVKKALNSMGVYSFPRAAMHLFKQIG